MATSNSGTLGREQLGQLGPLVGVIALCTAALTAMFVGVVGLASGQMTALVSRLPLYVLTSAVVFVGTLVVVDHGRYHGRTVLTSASVAGLAGFVTVSLGTEGVVYAVTNPGGVVTSHLFVYLLSAAIIASGMGYWVACNRREVRNLARTGL